MIGENFNWLCIVSDVPELHSTVVPTASQVVLFVGVEVNVPHQLAMGVLYHVHLSGRKGEIELWI